MHTVEKKIAIPPDYKVTYNELAYELMRANPDTLVIYFIVAGRRVPGDSLIQTQDPIEVFAIPRLTPDEWAETAMSTDSNLDQLSREKPVASADDHFSILQENYDRYTNSERKLATDTLDALLGEYVTYTLCPRGSGGARIVAAKDPFAGLAFESVRKRIPESVFVQVAQAVGLTDALCYPIRPRDDGSREAIQFMFGTYDSGPSEDVDVAVEEDGRHFRM